MKNIKDRLYFIQCSIKPYKNKQSHQKLWCLMTPCLGVYRAGDCDVSIWRLWLSLWRVVQPAGPPLPLTSRGAPGRGAEGSRGTPEVAYVSLHTVLDGPVGVPRPHQEDLGAALQPVHLDMGYRLGMASNWPLLESFIGARHPRTKSMTITITITTKNGNHLNLN